MSGDECRQWHLLTPGIGNVKREYAFRSHPRALLRLYHYTLLAAGVGEVVDDRRTESRGQGGIDGFETHAVGACLLAVDVHPQLRRFREAVHHRVEDDRVAVGLAE
ncbi:hypothetical protein D3C80_1380870 [compost metagenome]